VLNNDGGIAGGAGGAYAPFGGDGFYYGAGGNAGAGVVARQSAMIRNTGSIAGGDGGGGFYTGGHAGDGVDLLAGGTLVNGGVISAGAGGDATYAQSQAGGVGVSLAKGGMLTNTGTISGGAGGYSVFAQGGAGGAGVYINGGTVLTSGVIAGGAGGGGYVFGAAGDAVQFGSLAGTLEVLPGAVFDGAIQGRAGAADTLVLAGHAPGTLSGFGASITGITDIVADAGAHWRLDGALSGAGTLTLEAGARITLGGTVNIATIAFTGADSALHIDTKAAPGSAFTGFGAGDVIDLAAVQAQSLHFSAGVLSLYGANGGLVDTLHFTGNYQQSDFSLQPYGAGTDVVYAGAGAREGMPVVWHPQASAAF
jgi:hypothetical protein